MKDLRSIADFLFEVGMLAKTPRSWTSFLGSGKQSVSEHLTRTMYIGYVLASLHKNADLNKVLKMCLFHDLSEARISDLNYVHQKYTERKERKAVHDLTKVLPFGENMRSIMEEYEKRQSIESRLAKDADNIEFLLSLKEQVDVGNTRAHNWIKPLLERLVTREGKAVAEAIVRTDSDHWWFADKEDSWWINRDKKK